MMTVKYKLINQDIKFMVDNKHYFTISNFKEMCYDGSILDGSPVLRLKEYRDKYQLYEDVVKIAENLPVPLLGIIDKTKQHLVLLNSIAYKQNHKLINDYTIFYEHTLCFGEELLIITYTKIGNGLKDLKLESFPNTYK